MRKPYWKCRTHLLRRDEYICSECRELTDRPYAHCPGCGSKMNKTKKDGRWILEAELMDFILDDDEDW